MQRNSATPTPKTSSLIVFDDDPNDSFMCPRIRNYLQTHFLVHEHSVTTLARDAENRVLNLQVTLDWYFPENTLYDLVRLQSAALQWVQSVAALRWSVPPPSKRLTIIVFLTPFLKTWCPNDEHEITPTHMNSGQTEFFANGDRKITLWRREDFHKVFLHELLHAFGWDRLVSSPSSTTRESEALVEAVANLLHVGWMAGPSMRDVSQLMKQEQKHMVYQARILYDTKSSWKAPRTHPWEYCVLKAALLWNSDAIRDLQAFLALPSVAACHREWPRLVAKVLARLQASFVHRSPIVLQNQNPISMALVTRQFSLTG